MLNRRMFMAGATATPLARPALAQQAKVLRVVPQAVLNTIDPVWSSAQIVRNLGFMVFETLYGRDENLVPHPQMLPQPEPLLPPELPQLPVQLPQLSLQQELLLSRLHQPEPFRRSA